MAAVLTKVGDSKGVGTEKSQQMAMEERIEVVET